jgi:hypothetical protein
LVEISKDVDLDILLRGFRNGLIDFYDPIVMPPNIPDWPPYYLYFWYFIFFPIGFIPLVIAVYIWDILRFIIVSFIIIKSYTTFKNKKDIFIFYVFLTIGYVVDGWFNNVNFLILLFLFYSYYFLEQDKKLYSGIFFTLASFKINSILFVPILMLAKKIKWKELIYYLVPFILFCIPYMIFPDYFFAMINNWLTSEATVQGLTPLDSILWKALQPSHLMLLGIVYLTFFESINDYKRKDKLRLIVLIALIIYYVYLSIVAWVIPIFINQVFS